MPPSDSREYSAADELMAMVAKSLDEAELPYVVIGGQAVIQHGYGRSTHDVDITVSIGFERFEEAVQHFKQWGIEPRFEQDAQAIRLSQVYFGYHTELQVRVDFSFVDAPYLKRAIQRATCQDIEGYPVQFLSLEDLIVHKVVASRQLDLGDVEQLLKLHNDIDHKEVEHWLVEYEPLIEKDLIGCYRELRRQAEA